MTIKLINLLALSSLAILACSFGPVPVNALSGESLNTPRRFVRSHNNHFLKRKRDNVRCKARQPADSQPANPSSTPADQNQQNGQAQDQQNGGTGTPADGQPASTTNSPPASTPTPAPQSNNAGGGSKLGFAWPNGLTGDALKDLNNFNRQKDNKLYTWSPDHTPVDGFNPVPMLWGFNQVSQFQQQVNAGNAGGHVLGMNEPNQSGQSDMSPEDGCKLWQQNIAPLKDQGVRTVSPAPTSAPSGVTWLQAFFQQGCFADVIAIHWYDVDANDFISYVTNVHNIFNKPIWVTEYACQNFNGGPQCSDGDTWKFHQTVKGWMDGQDFVEHYFPFAPIRDMQGVNPDNQLMNQDGTPTALGAWYLDNQ